MKKLILVTSPPACGKTYISKELSKRLKHIVYLDKDSLIPLSKQIFLAAGEEYNRSSAFFEKYIRDYEYETVVGMALEALDYDDKVLINAPFTQEIRDKAYIESLKSTLKKKGAKRFGIHAFLSSNNTNNEYYPTLAGVLFKPTAIPGSWPIGTSISRAVISRCPPSLTRPRKRTIC